MNDLTKEHSKNQYTYEKISEIANYLSKRINYSPKIGIICGSGLGSMAESIQDAAIFNYEDIPDFPVSTVQGHAGRLIFGYISDIPVICMQGRFHYYEGYPLWKCVMPVRLMKLLGVTHLIASNAAGGLNSNFKVGDIMLIKDHVNVMGFAGNHPLIGLNDPAFGPRFFGMTKAYDPNILEEAKLIAEEIDLKDIVQEGVYTCLGGPNYETVAESKLLKLLGIDAVGMSTVHEVTAAVHCGIKCFAFSLITNMCVTEYNSEEEVSGEDVLSVGKMREKHLKTFVEKIVSYLGTEESTRNHLSKVKAMENY